MENNSLAIKKTEKVTGGKYSVIPKSKWKLTDSTREKIINMAKKDASQGIYMGKEYFKLSKDERSKVAPDRETLKNKVSASINSNSVNGKKDKLYTRWVCIMFGIPYEVDYNDIGYGHSVHVYNEYGEEVLIYTGGAGWGEMPTQAERDVWRTMDSEYYKVWCSEKMKIKSNVVYDNFDFESGNNFEVKA